jgi:polyferredoxin
MEDQSKQIEELKELVRRNIAITEDTNRQLHGMRRSSRWSIILRVLWWVAITAITAFFYYTYVFPYVNNILGLYNKAQQAAQNIPSFNKQ